MSGIQRISHVGIHVFDLDVVKAFYTAEVERQVALYRETGVIEEDFMHKQQLDR